MMRILVVDDEAPARDRLCRMLRDMPDVAVAGQAADAEEALAAVHADPPEVVLLDIRMPGMSGLELAMYLAELERPPAVIFTTAFDQHAMEAFDVQAVDYLLKPIRRERLSEALRRARRPTLAQLGALHEAEGGTGGRRHIAARIGDRLEMIPVASINYFQADAKYVAIHHAGGEVLVDEPLKDLETEFEHEFVRVHRNALVRIDAIEAVERSPAGGHVVRLTGGDQVSISRRHLRTVRQRLRAR